MIKRVFLTLLIILGVLLVLAAAFFGYLTVTEYRPAATESLELVRSGEGAGTLDGGGTVSVLSWNTGYAGLDQNADFFMDGGSGVRAESREAVLENLADMAELIGQNAPDFTLLQEVDSGSARTFGIDERTYYAGARRAYALNYACRFVPYPLPPIGRVFSGLLTLTDYELTEASRTALPSPFSWPVSTANLKRCLLVSRVPVGDGGDRELVLINLHLEAYDDGAGKAAQTAMLKELIEREYAAGNYVIAGGDFNQSFPAALDAFPIRDSALWTPGLLSDGDLSAGWQFAYDVSVPSCRLLNQPYDPDSPATQYYVIDGFILSPNVTLESVETLDAGFRYTDHNPVLLRVTLDSPAA